MYERINDLKKCINVKKKKWFQEMNKCKKKYPQSIDE